MVSYRMIAVAGFLASVSALPLNINLGAYSPALVVGDGEISFGGGQDVTSLMNALEGAAVNAATGSTRAATQNPASAPVAASPITTPVEDDGVVAAQSIPSKDDEISKALKAPEVPEASAASTTTTSDPNLEQQAAQISGLQGMGKEIAPRDSESPKAKRDLAGFDRALTFAEAALTKGPTIQLGTGEGGAGVGIIVDNNGGAVGERARAAAKRDESSSQPRRRTKVTRMYVKRGVPATIQTSSKFEARSVQPLPVSQAASVAKRESTSSDTIDAINLNVDDAQGFTMTFVETTEDDDDAAIDEAHE
ncbi:hypothetical protein F4813DRAFT_385709 [Daldinia decipiens]|uniref:uncharacterized protein n=1 Tax=Daldinia decipiens TaxID=326647 RepID=UPI0020C55FEE|nr:uncharacterized protein F4813DRAFT_385709 [Daldinia decipiens]KAI1661175.1 hypothetical protein F4813DRAFT_385709 [Daldinia decipiens]